MRFCFSEYLLRKNLSESCGKKQKNEDSKGREVKFQQLIAFKKILTRTQYCGYNTFCGETYKGNFEPIIDVEKLYNKTLLLLKRTREKIGRKKNKNH